MDRPTGGTGGRTGAGTGGIVGGGTGGSAGMTAGSGGAAGISGDGGAWVGSTGGAMGSGGTIGGSGGSTSATGGSGGGSGGVVGGGSGGGGAATGGAGTAGAGAATGGSMTGGTGGTAGVGGSTGTGGAAGSVTVGSAQCSDGRDNDGDNRIDLADPDCVSPLDNDESSLSTGIPGDNMDACKQDCFFDGNSGAGDDGCDWNLKCDPANTNPGQCSYDSNFHNCDSQQSQKCVNSCRKLTPNGCDCFGCCTVPGVSYPIRLTSTCTSATFGDPTKCPVCTQSTSCVNDCGRCEICLGKTSIPADCGSGGANGSGGSTGSGGGSGTGTGGTSGTGGMTGTGTGGTTPPPPPPECGAYDPCGPSGLDPAACINGTICITGCCIPT